MREKKGNKMWKRAIALLLGLCLTVGSVQVIAPREVQAAGSVPEITNDGLYRTVYEENFDDATIESLTAAGWDVTSGTTGLTGKYNISDGKLRGVASATTYYAGNDIKDESEYICEADITWTPSESFTTSGGSNINCGLVFGRDALNPDVLLILYVYYNKANQDLRCELRTQELFGNATKPSDFATIKFATSVPCADVGRTMKWKVEVKNDVFEVSLNDVYVFSYSYVNGITGAMGALYTKHATCGIDFDNFKFSTLNEDVLLYESFIGNKGLNATNWSSAGNTYTKYNAGRVESTHTIGTYYKGDDNGFSEYEWDHYTYSADLKVDLSKATNTTNSRLYGLQFMVDGQTEKAMQFRMLYNFKTSTWTWRLNESYINPSTSQAYGDVVTGTLPDGAYNDTTKILDCSLKVVVGNGDIKAYINDVLVADITPKTNGTKYRGNTKGTVGIVTTGINTDSVTWSFDNLVVLPYYVYDNFETYETGDTPFTTTNGWETDSTVSVQEVNGNKMGQLAAYGSKTLPKYKAFADGTMTADVVITEKETMLNSTTIYPACLYTRFETVNAREMRVRFKLATDAVGQLTAQLNLVVFDTVGLGKTAWQQYYTIPDFSFGESYHIEISNIGNFYRVSLDNQTIWNLIAPTDGDMADYSGYYTFTTGDATTYTNSYIDNLRIAEHATYNIENQCDTYVTPEKYPAIGGDSKSALLARNKYISGEELVFTAESANDYTIAPDTLSYTCVSDSTVTGKLEGSDGTYRFVMPSDDVTLSAMTYQVGDIDKDNGIDGDDSQLLRNYFVDGGDSFLMDSNEDGTVDARDLIRQTKKETVTDGAYLYIENFEEYEAAESPDDWQEDYVSASAKDNWEVYEVESANVDFDFATILSDLTSGSGGKVDVTKRMDELGFSATATLGGQKTEAGKLLMRSGNTWYLKNILGASGWSDYSVEAVVAIGNTNAAGNTTYDGKTAVNAGIAAAVDPTTGHGLEWRFTTKNEEGKWLAEIYDRANNTKVKKDIVTEAFDLNSDITLKLELNDNIAKFYVNGTCYDTYDASETLTGTAGFTSAGPTMTFTSFNVTSHKDEQKNAGNHIYGTQVTDGDTATWLHVFDDNPTAEFEFKVDQTASDAKVGFLIRRAPDTAFVNVGYDFTEGKWFITSQVAEEGGEAVSTTTWGEAYELLKNNWYTAKISANAGEVVLTIDGVEVVRATDVDRVEHGRIGAFTENAQMYLDNVQIEISSGDVPESGLLSYVLVPDDYSSYMELESPDDGTTLVGLTQKARWMSSNAGLTWSKLDDTSEYSGLSVTQYNSVIKMHNGQYLQVYPYTVKNGTTITDSQIKAQVSSDLKTWTIISNPVVPTADAYDSGREANNTILHLNSLTEVKLEDGTYRILCPISFYTYGDNGSKGHYTQVYYSDDWGQTWQASETTTKDILPNYADGTTTWAESKVVKCSDGTLRMYYSRNEFGYMAYTESTDNGQTWSGFYKIDYMPCARTSFAVYEDPTDEGTYYMLFVYRGTDELDTNDVLSPRNRICLMKSNNGKDWTFIMNCEWMSLYNSQTNSNGKDLYQILDPSLYVTEDYVYITFGRSETYVAGDSNSNATHMAQRCYYIRAEKEQLKGREWSVVQSMQQ